ncbi:cupin domain-containing protein [Promethearchaeum syntrophicum]|uniref:Cupin domain-containing protein n=1 Tax=Promethearchaeum syntrophicum TaxID=2594042 RepID=A0A5B9D7B7_9ARCH|nr:cupin domain-containing protein [Candidatus Prometheoarchaeum syntrophicum]QEE15049.1 Cupin domain protein [Candidatus Prometheoarchaeum syntrophicum]
MKHFHYSEIDEKKVDAFGSTETTIRVFISEEEAPNFIMRRFEIKPLGQIGVHSHDWEHEIFILNGNVVLINDKGDRELVNSGEFVFIPPNESHGYINEGNETVAFICMIPKKKI